MKNKLLYIMALGIAAVTTACSDDFTYPPMIVPQAEMKPNTTIADMKQLYWSNDRNYCSTIHPLSDGTDMIIKGRVVSSDSTGNVFKNIIVEDETAAITVAINAYSLYESYQYGQNIVIRVTGMQIGGYNGLMQIGSESTYNGQPSMTFMTKDAFDLNAEPDGLSNPKLVVPTTYTIAELQAAKANPTTLCLTQSKLVKIDGVTFENAGYAFAPTKTTDRYVKDAQGNRLNVRCSTYATFKNDIIPAGTGSVTGILSYYGSDWQLILNDLEGLEGFTPATPLPDQPEQPDKPDTPDTPSESGVIYTGLVDDANGWKDTNVTMDASLTYIWAWDAQYKCLKASSYKGQAFKGDSYFTTTVDLSAYKEASVTFDHVYRYSTQPKTDLTMVIRETGTTEWHALTIPNYPDGSNWTFIASGVIDLKAYAGKKVDIGFHYISTDAAAATWEIKNFKVSANK